jgi:hypothetical protein
MTEGFQAKESFLLLEWETSPPKPGGTRFSRSSASNSCRKVEPLRGMPEINTGRCMSEASRASNCPHHAWVSRNRVSRSSLPENPDEKPAQRMQIRLEFQAVHQNRERRFDRRVAKIFEPGPTPRLGNQRLALQQPQPPAQSIAQGPGCVRKSIPHIPGSSESMTISR